ncbi:MAG TPA: PqqD family protein [Acidimicrobiales bacterium]|nr:PqqD family protein [Acidimicrobiales bacterium]
MGAIASSSRPVRRPAVLDAVVDDEVVILGEADGAYHGLDPVGARVWQLLDGERTVEQICEQLVGEFDVTTEACLRDVTTFLDDLAANDLIEVAPGARR